MVSEAALPPGGEGKIDVTVNTAGRNGKMTKSVLLETDDPQTPNAHLTVAAEVLVDIALEQSYLRLDPSQKGDEVTAKVKILVAPEVKVRFTGVTSNTPGVTGEVIMESEAPVLLIRSEPERVGRMRALLQIGTDHPKLPKLMLTVSGEVRGPLSAQPARITLYEGDGSTRLTITGKDPFKILSVESPDGHIVAELAPVAAPQRVYEINLKVDAATQAAKRLLHSRVIIKTDVADQPELMIPFIYRLQQRGRANLSPLRKQLGGHP
ncbi:DUF1573 domain-containing protein [Myxococcota bacterium]|nr:DUF1573 domain-containing protein [Myxococcota bacterium]